MNAEPYPNSLWRRLCHTRLRDVIRGRLDARLDWRQVIARAELPPSLADVTTQVVRRTHLWRSEKVDVASELAAHFQDGLEFGHSPAELLQSFGDPQVAAKLIRRAKRRNRPLMWQLARYCVLGLSALFATYLVIGIWQSFGRPSVRTDYLLMVNKQAAAVPESERAWPLYRDALLAMGFDRLDDSSSVMNALAMDSKPGDAGWKEVDSLLADHGESMAKLREAAGYSGLGFLAATSNAEFSDEDRRLFRTKATSQEIEAAKHQTVEDRWIIATLIPDVQALRTVSALLAADARRAALTGDGQLVYDNVAALLHLSRHGQEMPFLVATLVAESIQSQARKVIHDVLAEHSALWTDDQLRDLAHLLATSRTDWAHGLDGERISFYDSMQRLYTDNGSGDGRLAISPKHNVFEVLHDVEAFDAALANGKGSGSFYSNAGLATLVLPMANMTIASRKEMIEVFDELTNRVQNKLDEPYWKRASEPRWDAEFQSLNSGPMGKFRYLFVDMLLPAYDAVLHRVTISDGERDGVFLGLALELHHRQHDKWPASLAELSPQYLPKLPVDPTTGRPLHFKIVGDRPLVYSEGADSDDDGGRAITEPIEATMWPQAKSHDGDWVLWSTTK